MKAKKEASKMSEEDLIMEIIVCDFDDSMAEFSAK
jgi:hypothetical protein